MLTLFTIPKPFRGHIGIIQRNAIQSWMRFQPECEIILCGDEEGTAEVAIEFGVRHLRAVDRNKFGSPLLNSMFENVQDACHHDILAYVNSDIILFQNFIEAVKCIPLDRPFAMIGKRWDLDITKPLDFGLRDWEERLRRDLTKNGVLQFDYAIDYFVFSKGLWTEIPPFAVGRPGYDNWLIYSACNARARVIHATKAVTCIHQNHERTYASVGLKGPRGETHTRGGVEEERNLEMMGGEDRRFSVRDAHWVIDEHGLAKAPLTRARLFRQLDVLPVLHPNSGLLFRVGKVWQCFSRFPRTVARRAKLILSTTCWY
jgi:hypothetical protein